MIMNTQNSSLVHVVQAPRERVPGKPPLLLLLHGFGSNEQDLFSLAPYLDKRFLCVSARAPVAIGAGAYCWFNLEFTPEGINADLEQAQRTLEMLPVFIDELIEAYEVDASCVYLAGFSQGAMMSYGLLLTRPELIAGVVAMSGRVPDVLLEQTHDVKALDGTPVLVTHGIYDPVLPVEHGREANKYLGTLPVELSYREYPMGHEVNAESLRDVTVWLGKTLDAKCATKEK